MAKDCAEHVVKQGLDPEIGKYFKEAFFKGHAKDEDLLKEAAIQLATRKQWMMINQQRIINRANNLLSEALRDDKVTAGYLSNEFAERIRVLFLEPAYRVSSPGASYGYGPAYAAVEHHVAQSMHKHFNDQAFKLQAKMVRAGLGTEAYNRMEKEFVKALDFVYGKATREEIAGVPEDFIHLAKALVGVNEDIRALQRTLGMDIGETPHYIGRLEHRAALIRTQKSDWEMFLVKNLDWEKVAELNHNPKSSIDASYKRDFLNWLFHAITDEGISAKKVASAAGNYASLKPTKARVVHFKSPSLEQEYVKQFGKGNGAFNNLIMSIHEKARHAAFHEVVGPDVDVFLKGLKADFMSEADALIAKAEAKGNKKQVALLESKVKEFERLVGTGKNPGSVTKLLFQESGRLSNPYDSPVNKISQIMADITSFVLLSRAAIIEGTQGVALGKTVQKMVLGSKAGVIGINEAMDTIKLVGNTVKVYKSTAGNKKFLKDIYKDLGYLSSQLEQIGIVHPDAASDPMFTPKGWVSGIQKNVHEVTHWTQSYLTMLNPVTDATRSKNVIATATHINLQMKQAFTDLEPGFKKRLSDRGVTDKVWAFLGKHRPEGGTLTLDVIDKIPDREFIGLYEGIDIDIVGDITQRIGVQDSGAKSKHLTKQILMSLYNMTTNFISPRPSKALVIPLLRGGRGTPHRGIVRFFTQIISTVWQNAVNYHALLRLAKQEGRYLDMMNLGARIFAIMYIYKSIVNILDGKEPPDLSDPKQAAKLGLEAWGGLGATVLSNQLQTNDWKESWNSFASPASVSVFGSYLNSATDLVKAAGSTTSVESKYHLDKALRNFTRYNPLSIHSSLLKATAGINLDMTASEGRSRLRSDREGFYTLTPAARAEAERAASKVTIPRTREGLGGGRGGGGLGGTSRR